MYDFKSDVLVALDYNMVAFDLTGQGFTTIPKVKLPQLFTLKHGARVAQYV